MDKKITSGEEQLRSQYYLRTIRVAARSDRNALSANDSHEGNTPLGEVRVKVKLTNAVDEALVRRGLLTALHVWIEIRAAGHELPLRPRAGHDLNRFRDRARGAVVEFRKTHHKSLLWQLIPAVSLNHEVTPAREFTPMILRGKVRLILITGWSGCAGLGITR